MKVYFCADLHLGHINMALHRGFSNVEEHNEHIIKKWNEVITKRDTVYILGDITMESSKSYHLLARLNGIKRVVGGNHDLRQHQKELLKYVECVLGTISYKGIFLSHVPVHPMEMDYRIKRNIHGHTHEKTVMKKFTFLNFNLFDRVDKRYTCVSMEQIGYQPKTLEQLGIKR